MYALKQTPQGRLAVCGLMAGLICGQAPVSRGLKVDIEVSGQRTCHTDDQDLATFVDYVDLRVTYRNEGSDTVNALFDRDSVVRFWVAKSAADLSVRKTEWKVDYELGGPSPSKPKLLKTGDSVRRNHTIDLIVNTSGDPAKGIAPGTHYLDTEMELIVATGVGDGVSSRKEFLRGRTPVRVDVPAKYASEKCKG